MDPNPDAVKTPTSATPNEGTPNPNSNPKGEPPAERAKVPRPSWLPPEWAPGDPLPKCRPEEFPEWRRATEGLNAENARRLVEKLEEIGDNARNQLARPCEYLARARRAESHLRRVLFGRPPARHDASGRPLVLSLGKNRDGSERTEPALAWQLVTHPALEVYYDRSPTSCTYSLVFYVSFCGSGVPARELWDGVIRGEMVGTKVEEVATDAYVAVRSPENGYLPQKRVSDPFVLRRYARRSEPPSNPGPSSLPSPEEDGEWITYADKKGETRRVYDSLRNTLFEEAYLCNMFDVEGHPTLSGIDGQRVGNADMLNREARERGASPLAPLTPTQRSRLNEEDWGSAARAPLLSTVCHLSSPDSGVLYVNMAAFRRDHSRDARGPGAGMLTRVFGKDEVGCNTLLKAMTSYRITVKMGVAAYRNLDYVPRFPPYREESAFDRYLSHLKRRAASGTAAVEEMEEETPLMNPQEEEYRRLVGMTLTSDLIQKRTTPQLERLVRSLVLERPRRAGDPVSKRRAPAKSSRGRRTATKPKKAQDAGKGKRTAKREPEAAIPRDEKAAETPGPEADPEEGEAGGTDGGGPREGGPRERGKAQGKTKGKAKVVAGEGGQKSIAGYFSPRTRNL
jgi:hypothetical protein